MAKKLEPYRGIDAVLVWEKAAGYMSVTIPQYEYYSSVTFFYKSDPDEVLGQAFFAEGRDVMLVIGPKSMEEEYLKLVLDAYPEYEAVKLGNIDRQSHFVNYYLHRSESGGT